MFNVIVSFLTMPVCVCVCVCVFLSCAGQCYCADSACSCFVTAGPPMLRMRRGCSSGRPEWSVRSTQSLGHFILKGVPMKLPNNHTEADSVGGRWWSRLLLESEARSRRHRPSDAMNASQLLVFDQDKFNLSEHLAPWLFLGW